MRKLYLVAAFLVAALAATDCYAQKMALPEHFGGWSGKPSPEWVETEAPRNYVDIWKETGRTTGEYCQYSSGTATVGVSLHKFQDPTSAYEAYTALLGPPLQLLPIAGRNSAANGTWLLVLVGNFILNVSPPQGLSPADLEALEKAAGASADKSPLPPVRTYLPENGLRNGTQKYALGPAGFQSAFESLKRPEYAGLAKEAGFSSGAEAMLAEYQSGKDLAVLLLLEYPTPQLAELHSHHLQSALSGKLATTKIERKGSLLSMVLGASSTGYAEKLRNSVNYETQVTWNEPSQTMTDPPITSTLVKIITGTGVIMVLAIVLGIAFGGVRVLTKKFFPGKVFDRSEGMDILQLGLSGKPIKSRDLY
ncbi:MAG TPA: DUF6599 family protein [Candidatus Acidoferrum sp.]|jgi:hypothetical protein